MPVWSSLFTNTLSARDTGEQLSLLWLSLPAVVLTLWQQLVGGQANADPDAPPPVS